MIKAGPLLRVSTSLSSGPLALCSLKKWHSSASCRFTQGPWHSFDSIAGLIGLALLVGGTVYGILGFWGVSRGSDGSELLAIGGIVSAIIGGALVWRAPRFELPRRRSAWATPEEDLSAAPPGKTQSLPVKLFAILGFVLFVGGALYLILGLWGMTRGGFDAWKFASWE